MNRLISFIVTWPKAILVGVLICSVPFGYAFFQKSFLNHVRLYFEKDDPAVVAYNKFQETYGNEELALIAVHGENLFTRRALGIIRDISRLAKSTEGIQRVFSLTEATRAVGDRESVGFVPVVSEADLEHGDLKRIRKRVLEDEILTNILISPSGKTTAIILELAPIASNEKKGELLIRIKNEAERIAGGHVRLYFSGVPYVENEITSLTRRDDRKFTPITIVVIFLLSLLIFRRISLALFCLANLILTFIWGVGLFVLTGHSFMMITVVMPPILLAICVADAVHILSHYQSLAQIPGQTPKKSVSETVSKLWLPCLFTSLTTGIGFLSFVTAKIAPVRTLGIFTFIGVMIAFLITIVVLPAILMALGGWRGKGGEALSHKSRQDGGWIALIGEFTIRRYREVLFFFGVLMVVALVGTFRITYETNFVRHLSKTNQLRQDMQFIEQNLFGTVPIVLLVRAKSPENDFTHPQSLKLLEEIQTNIKRDLKGRYTCFFSVADYFKSIHKAFNQGDEAYYAVPDNQTDILDYYELGESETLDRIVSPDRMEARISFNGFMGPIKLAKTLDGYVKSNLKELIGDHYTCHFTGLGSLYVTMDRNLRTSQIRSLSAALIIIFSMMLVICKNLKLTLISMVPNIFPIMCNFGLMGYWGIPLDVSTIMIASVTIGIAVDDTIHFLVWYRRNVFSGNETRAALRKTYQDAGRPIIATSLILFIAFFIFISGSVKPVQDFGFLTGLSMLFALIGDLFLFPAMILFFKPNLMVEKSRLHQARTSSTA